MKEDPHTLPYTELGGMRSEASPDCSASAARSKEAAQRDGSDVSVRSSHVLQQQD